MTSTRGGSTETVSWRAPAPGAPLEPPASLPTSPSRSPESAPWSLRHVPALDGIRGLAVLAVLLYHGDALTGGYLGVDAFFVLSGFLITALLLGEVRTTHRVNLGAFWLRRAKRLLPALFVLLLGVALYAAFVASSDELGRIRDDALATLGYVANWHSIGAHNDYWSLFQAPSPLEHTWSLAIEEQFYLVWPLVVFGLASRAGRKRRPDRPPDRPADRGVGADTARAVLIVSVVGAAAAAAWMATIVDPGGDTSRAYLGTDTRAASILVGAALAALLTLRGPVRGAAGRRVLEGAAIGAFLALGVAWATLEGQATILYRGALLACSLGVVLVIAAASHPKPGVVSRVLSLRVLCWLGLISYGLYLWHWPIYLVVTEDRTGLDGAALLALRIAISIAVAWISFTLVEMPIRRSSMSGRRAALAIPVAAVLCIGAVVFTTTGATSAGGPMATESVVSKTDDRGGSASGAGDAAGAETPRVLVLGDSVAGTIGESFQYLHAELGIEAGTAALAGCLLEDGVPARALIHGAIKALEPGHSCVPTWMELDESFGPDRVVLVYGSAASFQELDVGGAWSGPCDPAYQQWYVPRLQFVVSRLAAAGATVTITRLPQLVNDWAPDDSAIRIGCVNEMNATVAQLVPGTRVADLAGFVCPAGACKSSIDGSVYRVDGMHFSRHAATEIARWLYGEAVVDTDASDIPESGSAGVTPKTGPSA